jgi:hypothetical protein
MAITTFIPTIWEARLLAALHKSLVFASPNVVNRQYEGVIRQRGDTVKINSVGAPTIKTYVNGTAIDAPEALTTTDLDLVIDQAKYFNFHITDVDRVQAAGGFDDALRESAYGLRDVADQYVAAQLLAGTDAGNLLGSSGTPKTIATASDAYDYLVDLGVLLDEANVPAEFRYAVIPPWYHGLLRKDDRFVGSGADAADQRLATGLIGDVAGMPVYRSNNCVTGATYYVVQAGSVLAQSYADQIVKVEAYRPEGHFSDALKGLHVYGTTTVRPTALAAMYVTRP